MSESEQSRGWRINNIEEFPKGPNESHNPFGNPFYGYRQVDLTLPGDKPATFFGILVGPCVHSVIFGENDTTYLVRQKRPNALQQAAHRAGKLVVPETWELPGGFAKYPDDIERSAREELEEEARGRGLTIRQVGSPYTAPGVSDEVDHIFVVEGFNSDTSAQGSDEATEADMDIMSASFDEIYGLAMSGEIQTSSQTLAGLALARYNR